MNRSLETLFADFIFSLENITWVQLLDLFLVAFIFYVLLNLLRRSRATVLLRGTLLVVALFFVFTVFLPLPTFDYLIQFALIAMLVAIPVIFQPELRFLLEELGRSVGSFSLQVMTSETTLKPLVRAVENLSANHVGALIVLEGEEDLSNILETGVPIGAEVTSELLQTLFYDGTPLHDGAVIIRGNRVVAAGCVLPVSNRQLYAGGRRLGTRHRAAAGLTETSDALALVVSEETGEISVGRNGSLQSAVDKTVLRDQVHQFYRPGEKDDKEAVTLRRLWERLRAWWLATTLPESRTVFSNSGLIVLAFLLALASWMFVIERTNPIRNETISGIPLQVIGPPPGMRLMSSLPETVTINLNASERVRPSLSAESFQAELDLTGLEPGLHRLAVDVQTEARPVQIVSTQPGELDVQLAEVITRAVPVRVLTLGEETMSPAVRLSDDPEPIPPEVEVIGAAPNVERVAYVRVDISVESATGPLEQVRPVLPVDENGSPVDGITVRPEQVRVSVGVEKRADARDVGVRIRTEGETPDGYRLSRLLVTPAQVTLLGSAGQLAEMGSAVFTFPVDISNAIDDLRVQAALDLPFGLDAVNSYGEPVRSVLVQIEVVPREGNEVFWRNVEVQGGPGLSFSITPTEVEVFLSGPVPLLAGVEASPRLLQVTVDATELEDLAPGESREVTPQLIAPRGLRAQLQPKTVIITAR